MTDRGANFRMALKIDPALAAEQQQHEHDALMREARLHDQMLLQGIEPANVRETVDQQVLAAWSKAEGLLMVAIPNGAYLQGDKAQRAKQYKRLEREGLWPGCPDVVYPGTRFNAEVLFELYESVKEGCSCNYFSNAINRALIPALWIEMKRFKGGKLSDDQIKAHKRLRELGDRVEVCKGAAAAKAVVRDHFGIE